MEESNVGQGRVFSPGLQVWTNLVGLGGGRPPQWVQVCKNPASGPSDRLMKPQGQLDPTEYLVGWVLECFCSKPGHRCRYRVMKLQLVFFLFTLHSLPHGRYHLPTKLLRVTLDEGPWTNEFKQSYWSKPLNWSQGLQTRVQDQKVAN